MRVSTKAITRHLVPWIFGVHASEIPELPNPDSSFGFRWSRNHLLTASIDAKGFNNRDGRPLSTAHQALSSATMVSAVGGIRYA
jgi:hypothetical protein